MLVSMNEPRSYHSTKYHTQNCCMEIRKNHMKASLQFLSPSQKQSEPALGPAQCVNIYEKHRRLRLNEHTSKITEIEVIH